MWKGMMAGLAAMVVLSGCNGGAKEHPLDGSVLILQSENFVSRDGSCLGTGEFWDLAHDSPVKITPKGKEPVFTSLSVGTVTPEGNCRLKFAATIPEAESYVFEVGGRLPQTKQKAAIDGSIGGRDDWWVTLGYD
jgi:hypothetical protein